MTKGLSLVSTWNQDAAGARPWCRSTASLPLSEACDHETMVWAGSRTPSLTVQLAEVAKTRWIQTGPCAIRLSTAWWVKLLLASVRVVPASCPAVCGSTYQVSTVAARKFVWCFGCCASTESGGLYNTGSGSPIVRTFGGAGIGHSIAKHKILCFSVLQLWIAKYTPLTHQYTPLLLNRHPCLSNNPCGWNIHPWLSITANFYTFATQSTTPLNHN